MKRRFTRAQVEQQIMSTHNRNHANEAIHIIDVSLLRSLGDDWSIPVWVVKFKRVYNEGTPFEQAHQTTVILTERFLHGEWYLWYLSEATLPEHCATPGEEDAALHKVSKKRMYEACS
ncbi:MAG TPA: hypothetical protein VFB60_11430 [Ktedonobacteraceae bacterium]|nr:hypothetical protein [Ktedonobacteraceae bacterium]